VSQLGRFQIVREIARSNDIVWEGVDPALGRRVAIKELFLDNGDPASRSMRIARFEREAKAAGALSHPNIVVVHEFGSDNGRHYIAMEYLEGRSLRERLRAEGRLPEAEARRIAGAVCDALEYAHARGVVHRDVKPDNIHLLPDGRVKLTDFGIARIAEEVSLTVAGQVYGTPSYMAPEQIRGGAVDARTDIFGIGIVLYEMLAGAKPFTGERIETITYRILTEPTPPLPSGLETLDAVVRRATDKDPNRRFGSAGEMGRAIAGHGVASPAERTMAFPAQRTVAMPTVGYGQSDRTIAAPPAFASPPPVPPAPAPAAPQAASAGSRTLPWILAGIVLGALAITGVLLVPKAVRNQGLSVAAGNAREALNRGVRLYEAKDFAQAAVVFANVRTAPGADSDTIRDAKTYEGYCYRSLAGLAQTEGRWNDAVRWWALAKELAPDDAEVAKGWKDASDYAASLGAPRPAPEPEPDRTTEHPKPRREDTPNLSTSDLRRSLDEDARAARQALADGDAAAQRGDTDTARQLWERARELGVGTEVLTEAVKRLRSGSRSESP